MKPTRSLNVDRKPVYWSPSTRTALAEAELEYPEASQALTFEHKKQQFSHVFTRSEFSASKLQDHVSPSIYVAFKCIESRSQHTVCL